MNQLADASIQVARIAADAYTHAKTVEAVIECARFGSLTVFLVGVMFFAYRLIMGLKP